MGFWQTLIGQRLPQFVSDYIGVKPTVAPYFHFVREASGRDGDGVPSWVVAGYFAGESGTLGDDVIPLNVVVQRRAGDRKSNQIGVEINVNNNGAPVGLDENCPINGLHIGSGGDTHPGTGLKIGSVLKTNAFNVGIDLQAARFVGFRLVQSDAGEGILLYRNNDTAYKGWLMRFMTADGTGMLLGVDIDGALWIRGNKVAG